MKSKVLFLWVLAVCSISGFAASSAMAEPVWRELDNYSEKDKAYVQQRSPQLDAIQKQITELKGKPANRATTTMIEELEAKQKQLLGELTEHEFKISSDVAGFATTRSKDAETRLKELRGEGDKSQPKELREFEERVKKERAALDEELKKLPPDPEETARQELQDKLKKISNEEDEKIRKIPAGPKKIKRDEFEKRVAEERKTLKEKLGIPASPAAPASGAPQLEAAPPQQG